VFHSAFRSVSSASGTRIQRIDVLNSLSSGFTLVRFRTGFVLALRIRHDKLSESDGIRQISRYMDKLGQKAGYLLIFEKKSSEELPWEERLRWEVLDVEGREVTLVVM